MPVDEEIYGELIADEKSTEEDTTAEIDRTARLKADCKDLQLSTKN